MRGVAGLGERVMVWNETEGLVVEVGIVADLVRLGDGEDVLSW